MTVKEAIKIMTDSNRWIYEGSTKIDGRRAYMMRKYCGYSTESCCDSITQTVIYFTTHGLRLEATREKLRHETHFS